MNARRKPEDAAGAPEQTEASTAEAQAAEIAAAKEQEQAAAVAAAAEQTAPTEPEPAKDAAPADADAAPQGNAAFYEGAALAASQVGEALQPGVNIEGGPVAIEVLRLKNQQIGDLREASVLSLAHLIDFGAAQLRFAVDQDALDHAIGYLFGVVSALQAPSGERTEEAAE